MEDKSILIRKVTSGIPMQSQNLKKINNYYSICLIREQDLIVGRLSNYPVHVNSVIDRNVEKMSL